MTESTADVEVQQDRVPFRIRGHHLQQYSALVKGLTPDELAGEILRSARDTQLWSFRERQSC